MVTYDISGSELNQKDSKAENKTSRNANEKTKPQAVIGSDTMDLDEVSCTLKRCQ